MESLLIRKLENLGLTREPQVSPLHPKPITLSLGSELSPLGGSVLAFKCGRGHSGEQLRQRRRSERRLKEHIVNSQFHGAIYTD